MVVVITPSMRTVDDVFQALASERASFCADRVMDRAADVIRGHIAEIDALRARAEAAENDVAELKEVIDEHREHANHYMPMLERMTARAEAAERERDALRERLRFLIEEITDLEGRESMTDADWAEQVVALAQAERGALEQKARPNEMPSDKTDDDDITVTAEMMRAGAGVIWSFFSDGSVWGSSLGQTVAVEVYRTMARAKASLPSETQKPADR